MGKFGKEVAKGYREIKDDFEKKDKVDPQVKEQIKADLDGLIKKNDESKI